MEDNLRTLDVEQLGAVNLRLMDPDDAARRVAPVPLEDQLAEMVALRDEGKIGGVGISNASLEQVETAIALAGIVCVQNPFSLLDRHDAAVLDRCQDAGVAYVPFFPLGSAFPHLPKVTEDPTVSAIAERLGAHAGPGRPGLAARAPRRHPADPGDVELAHLEENMAVAAVDLSTADLEALDEAAAPG